jgi:hypothetical protein
MREQRSMMIQKIGVLSGRLDYDSVLISFAYSLPLDNKRFKHEGIISGQARILLSFTLE